MTIIKIKCIMCKEDYEDSLRKYINGKQEICPKCCERRGVQR